VVQRSKKPFETGRLNTQSNDKIMTLVDFRDQVLNSEVPLSKTQMTHSYIVAVQDLDQMEGADPAKMQMAKDSSSRQFKASHPSLVMPKHPYRKYKMKEGR